MVGTGGLAQRSVSHRFRWEEDDERPVKAMRTLAPDGLRSQHDPFLAIRERGASAHELGAKIQADARRSLRRLDPEWTKHWFGAHSDS